MLFIHYFASECGTIYGVIGSYITNMFFKLKKKINSQQADILLMLKVVGTSQFATSMFFSQLMLPSKKVTHTTEKN